MVHSMKRVVIAASLLSVIACQPAADPNLEPALQTLMDNMIRENPVIPAAALYVHAPRLGLTWSGAVGLADPTAETKMTPEHPIRIASMTKTFVSVAILRLVEQGRLDLDDSIAAHLPNVFIDGMQGDGYLPDEMTVRHLLTHTSGLFDYAESENYLQAILADPQHRWTLIEQFEGAMEWGDPLGAPGEFYSYSDTGYVLLGEILAQVTGKPLAVAVRELVNFEKLGLNSTWWETFEPRPENLPDRAHQFLGELDVTDFDPSFDLYGGGGLVSTVRDQAHFLRELFNGGVYENPETVDVMLSTVEGSRLLPDAPQGTMPAGAYRMGVWVYDAQGLIEYRHTGFFGTAMTYVPELDLTIAATVNQNSGRQQLSDLVHGVTLLVRD